MCIRDSRRNGSRTRALHAHNHFCRTHGMRNRATCGGGRSDGVACVLLGWCLGAASALLGCCM
eukprot:3741239-Lingulodinium_polyedra.AAC.1